MYDCDKLDFELFQAGCQKFLLDCRKCMIVINLILNFSQAGETAILNCSFYLHSDQLYSVKWFKVKFLFHFFIKKNTFESFQKMISHTQNMQQKQNQGRHQFFSYIPSQSPTTRFFPVKGMKLDVGLKLSKFLNVLLLLLQINRSKPNQLVLTSVSWRLTGVVIFSFMVLKGLK